MRWIARGTLLCNPPARKAEAERRESGARRGELKTDAMISSPSVASAKASWLCWALADRPWPSGLLEWVLMLSWHIDSQLYLHSARQCATPQPSVSSVPVLSSHPARMAEYPAVADLQPAWVQHSHHPVTHEVERACRRLRASLLPYS